MYYRLNIRTEKKNLAQLFAAFFSVRRQRSDLCGLTAASQTATCLQSVYTPLDGFLLSDLQKLVKYNKQDFQIFIQSL